MTGQTLVRACTLDDADMEFLARLRGEVFPYRVQSVASQRNVFRTVPERAGFLVLLAERDGVRLGMARAMLDYGTSEPGAAQITVSVLPEQRGRGVGTALLAAAEAHLRAVGGTRARGWCPDTPRSLTWAQRHGYEPGRVMRYSMVDPRTVPPTPPVPAGVRLVAAAEAGPRVVYEIDAATTLDEPGDTVIDMMPYDEWLAMHWHNPDHHPELGTVAYVADVPAAVVLVDADPASGRYHSAYTGVLREFRGRGLAKLAKTDSLHRAAAAGYTAAYTSNDGVNAPMLAVNAWLGYQPTAVERSCRKTL
ncbi:GNAT family N-acetyltransferase [Catellatospora tritici]|uniref:GNAT family N-acetyltransferase n=1 Tax=Catellatospora tritici TaxID=2851566 RepID=UPI001C2D22BF|nr:GNAT family N-acetyltransferase [Catellatospora tritici]MBV1851665.1 GNAT family N-acetyltransferase [Catellatospora tritici]